jgi:hypothetical protein
MVPLQTAYPMICMLLFLRTCHASNLSISRSDVFNTGRQSRSCEFLTTCTRNTNTQSMNSLAYFVSYDVSKCYTMTLMLL